MSLALAVSAAVLAVVGLVLVLAWPRIQPLFRRAAEKALGKHSAAVKRPKRVVQLGSTIERWPSAPYEIVPARTSKGGHR